MGPEGIRDKIEELTKLLVSATQTRGMYGEKHNLTQGAVDRVYSSLSEILWKEEDITIGVIGNEVAFKKEPFYKISKHIKGFIEHLKETGVEKISFVRGVEKSELSAFITLLSMTASSIEKNGVLDKLFSAACIKRIAFGKIALR